MANLPEPVWITLSESARPAAQAFGAELSAVEPALVAAFHDGKIRTRGRCRSYFNDDWLHDLARSTWDRAGVVWQGNEFAIPSSQLGRKIHIFEDVVVHREDLEKWVNGAMPDSQGGPQEAAEAPPPGAGTPSTPETPEPNSHSSKAVSRGILKSWLEKRAKKKPVLTKKQCLEAIQSEGNTAVTMNMIKEAWQDAKLPETWRKQGRRPAT